MNKIVNGVANDYEFPDLDWIHHDSKTINENYFKAINGTALYYENYVQQLQQQIDQLTNNWNELEEWLKEKQNLVCGCGITPEYIYAYENVLDKMNEIKDGNNGN